MDEQKDMNCESNEQFPPETPQEAPQMPSYAIKKKRTTWKGLPMLLSFLLPLCVTTVCFLLSLFGTDGTNMLLASDGWHQYYPFLVSFREKLLSGGSLEYSWTVGMGQSYPSLFAYYLASPMYLLSVLVPLNLLPHFFTMLTIVKISLAGLFMGHFLRIVYRRNEVSIAFFGLMYALCAWAAGYYWNIMWLDTFALLPLLVAGTVSLLRDGKFRLYTISLALSLWCNYYVAFFCCIFVLLCFLGFVICRWNGLKNFMRRLVRIGLCTALAVGMALVLLLPTLKAMQTTYSANASDFPLFHLNIADEAYGHVTRHDNLLQMLTKETLPGIVSAAKQVFTGLMPATVPTDMEGLPNVFCSFTAVILAIYYFCCRKISKREKIFNLCLLIFLTLSFIVRYLDYVWHGFHFPNMLPYRFSFLFSFVLVAMAYRAFTLMDDFKLWHLLIITPFALLFVYNASVNCDFGSIQQLLTLVVLVGVLVFFVAYFFLTRAKEPTGKTLQLLWSYRKALVSSLLLTIILCEMVISLIGGIDAVGLTTQYNVNGSTAYPQDNDSVQALLSHLDSKKDDPLFYRTEVTTTQTLNDAALNRFNGVSIFNSSANANFNRLTRSLGLASWVGSNRFIYYEASPFTNTMCGIKYLLDRDGGHRNLSYNALLASADDVNLLQNHSFVSVGFMTQKELGNFIVEESNNNPVSEQSLMFRLATGVSGALYDTCTTEEFETPFGATVRLSDASRCQYNYSTLAAAEEKQKIGLIFTVEQDGLYVASTKRPQDADNKVKVYCNDNYLYSFEGKVRMLQCVGTFEKGDKIKFVYEVASDSSNSFELIFARHNDYLFDEGLRTLSDEPFLVEEFSDGYVRGSVNALQDGFFYTSIPYEPGWTAYVDGKEVEMAEGYDPKNTVVRLSDCVVSFPLSAGEHDIELVYSAPGLKAGLVITILSLLGFAALCWYLRKKPILLPDSDGGAGLADFALGATFVTFCTAAVAFLMLNGAKKGYPGMFEKLNPDEAFAVFAIVFVIGLAVSIHLWNRTAKLAWKKYRPATAPAEAQESTEETEEAEEMEEILATSETEEPNEDRSSM
ncbi:MAG: hypothetical protein E7467_07150 [Ruminococcaceae bacterium]|nr:hypothetical protein [Oscillospiraceae bacterium]